MYPYGSCSCVFLLKSIKKGTAASQYVKNVLIQVAKL